MRTTAPAEADRHSPRKRPVSSRACNSSIVVRGRYDTEITPSAAVVMTASCHASEAEGGCDSTARAGCTNRTLDPFGIAHSWPARLSFSPGSGREVRTVTSRPTAARAPRQCGVQPVGVAGTSDEPPSTPSQGRQDDLHWPAEMRLRLGLAAAERLGDA